MPATVKEALDRVVRDIDQVKAGMNEVRNGLRPFLSRHKPGRRPMLIGRDWNVREETDEPDSAIADALWELESAGADNPAAIRALFGALRSLDGALRDIRALRLDLATIAGDPTLTSRFRRD